MQKPAARSKVLCALIALCAAAPTTVLAQGRTLALEEVIVTAQKRAESLQDAPIAVSALTSEQLEQRGIQGLADMMAGALPAIKIQPFPQNPGTLIIAMRGIGPADAGQITKEPGVGIYMDGIYLGRSQGLGLDLVDLERVEVLRGPQGTLYGRNVMGGAVNLISRKPAGEFDFRQTLSYGDKFGEFKSITHVDTPSVGGFSAKFSYLYHDHEGWVENQGSGSDFQDYNAYEKNGGRIALRWTNDNNVTVDYAFDISDNKFMQNYFQLYYAGNLTTFNADVIDPPNLGLLSVPVPEWGPDQFELLGNISSGAYFGALEPFPNDEPPTEQVSRTRAALALRPSEVETQGHAFTVEWDVNDSLTFRSLTSFRELDQETHANYAGVFGIGLATSDPFDQIEQEQWSQEFQFVGSALDDSIEWVAGLYYYHEEVSEVTPPTSTAMEVAFVPLVTSLPDLANPGAVAPFIVTRGGELSTLDAAVPLVPGSPYPNRVVSAETDSWALYGQARWQATENLGLTLGLRYTNDQKDSERPSDNGVFLGQVSNIEDNSTDPMVTLDYNWTQDVNTYLRYATGYKAGGVNLRSTSFVEYDKETLETWELGLKSTFWDSRARVNLALWDSTYKDYQIDFSDPMDVTVSETFNASNGDVDLSGIEVEFSIVPVEGLTIGMDYNYISWDLLPQPNPLNPGGPLEIFEIPQAPRHAGAVSIDYEFVPFSFGTLLLHLDYVGQSSARMRWSPKDNLRRDGRDVINARIMLADIPVGTGALRASIWGRNIMDKDYVSYSITNTGVQSISDAWGEPSIWGVELTYQYR